ncbi:MAG: hypothetical protein ACYTFM_12360 [Planctomycetota bacterium]
MKYKGSDGNGKQLHILHLSTPRSIVGADKTLASSTEAKEEGTASDG